MPSDQQPRAADQLRRFAESIGDLEIPGPVKMMIGDNLDLDGAAAVMRQAAGELDRLDNLEARLKFAEGQLDRLDELETRVEVIE